MKIMNWIKKNIITVLVILSVICLIFSFLSPFLFTRNSVFGVDFSETGQIGDTIGGLMNPFISVSAVLVTGLAFYAQYKANEVFKRQIEFQKFENQFYEMLRLHKENVNEIEIETIKGEKIRGRNAFFEMKKDLENLFLLNDELTQSSFKMNYNIFFWGFEDNRKPIKYRNMTEEEFEEFIENFGKSSKGEPSEIEKYSKGEDISFDISGKLSELKIHKLKGHHNYLGHYCRHLFLTVKFVVKQKNELVSEEQKMDYLRILRAQLSNYEQIMLFYNWLSGYGATWEDDKNRFFTKYKMIHNLWYNEMYSCDFIEAKLKELVAKKEMEGILFEIGDEIEMSHKQI